MDISTKVLSQEIEEDLVQRWVAQFLPEERPYILKLINNFKYYGLKKTNSLLRIIYSKIIEDNLGKEVYFVPVGYVARSGAAVTYLFRIQNNIPQAKFTTIQDIIDKNLSNNTVIILIDDFIGTGTQSISLVNKIKADFANKNLSPTISYAVITGLESGIKAFKEATKSNVYFGEEITAQDLPLSETSKIFKKPRDRQILKEILIKYGIPLYREHPLGYKNAGALVGFFYSTPNNTLPIFWSTVKDWIPLLPYSESLKDIYTLVGPFLEPKESPFIRAEKKPLIEANNLINYDLPEQLVNIILQEFHSLPIVLSLAPIIKRHNFSFQLFSNLLDIVRELKHLQHERESVRCTLSIVPNFEVKNVDSEIFVSPAKETNINSQKETVAMAQLIDGYAGGLVITSDGVILGVSNFKYISSYDNYFLSQKYYKAASFSRQYSSLLFLFEGNGKVLVFSDGQQILSHRSATWHLHTSQLINTIDNLSVEHSVNSHLLRDLLRLAIKMTNEGKGGLLTFSDAEKVLTMTNKTSARFLDWKQLKLTETPDEALTGLFGQDGATVISNEGIIVDGLVQLQPDPSIICEEEVGKGTKHKTAGKVSAVTNAITIAISVDGRITVFSKGKIVLKIVG